jgi:hypothetical protein
MRTPPKNGRAPASTAKPQSKKKLLEGLDQATLCRAAAVSLALVAHLPSLLDGDVRDVLDPDYDSEESLIEALRTCAFGVDGGGCRRPASCLLTLLLKGSSTITKRLINVLLHGRVAWRAFDVALAITQDHAAALAGVGLTICAHPLHAEAVSWTGARSLLLATVFVLEAVKRHLDGDSVGGALFTLVACSAHAAAAASPFLMMVIHSNDLAPSMLAACLGAWLFLGIDGSRVYDAQARAPLPVSLPPREWYASVRDGLASISWYAASFVIPPENPIALRYALFDRAQLAHASLASQRTVYALAFSGLITLFVLLRKYHTIKIALRYGAAFSLSVAVCSAACASSVVSDRVAYLPSIVAACLLSIGVAFSRGRGPAISPIQELDEDYSSSSSDDHATPSKKRKNGAVPKPSGLAKLAGDCCVALSVCCAGLQALRNHVRAQPYANELALLRAATRSSPDDAVSWAQLGDALRTAPTDEPWFRETDATKAYEAAVDAGLEPEPCGLLALRPRPVPATIAGCYEQRADVFGRGSHDGVLQLFEAAKWHTRGGDFKKATRNLLRVKKALPRDPELWVQFGLARRGAGKLAPAVEAYERAVELDPACVEAYQNWGNLELGRENRPRALELFRRELELDPSHRSRFENYASDPDIQALLKGEPFTERPVPPPVQPPADPPEEVWGES